MAANTINTRIQLKYDTLSNWLISSNNNFIPLKGEVCVAEIPTNDSNSNHLSPPAIGIKVGDGTNTFINLPWIQALAGDVHGWAKASTKPTYDSTEISATTFDSTPTTSTVQAVMASLNNKINTLTAGSGSGSIADQINSAIEALDGSITGTPGVSKTLTAFSETDGIVTATFADIAIAQSQVANLVSDLALKAPLASPGFSGTPTAPTAAAGTNTTQIATTAFVKNAVDTATAGLSGAMHYIGAVTANPTTTAPTGTFNAGDVVTFGNSEFVYDGTNWRELGDEGSYALKTITITGSDGLTGGGAISANQQITHAVPSGATADTHGGTSGTRTYIQSITTDKFGHIVAVTTATETVTDTTYTFAEGTVNGEFSVTPLGGTAQQVKIHGLGAAAYKGTATTIINGETGLVTGDQVYDYVDGILDGLDSSVSATAASGNVYSVLTSVTQSNGKLTGKTEVTLAAIAKTGSIYDVIEHNTVTENNASVNFLIFDCGDASHLVTNPA